MLFKLIDVELPSQYPIEKSVRTISPLNFWFLNYSVVYLFYSYHFCAFVGSVLTAERSVKPGENERDWAANNNQQGELQQVEQLSSSVLVEIVGHAVCNVKENKVLAESFRIERSNYS